MIIHVKLKILRISPITMIVFIINYINMTEQQDEFLVDPQVQEVRDLKQLAQPVQLSLHQAKSSREQAEHVHLKIVVIPKEQIYAGYRPFRFERVSESQSSEEEEILSVRSPVRSAIQEFYSNHPCVYQRFNNKQLNQVSNNQLFTGLFAHRKVLLQTNCKETHQLPDVLKQRLGMIDLPLSYSLQRQDLIFDSKFESGNLFAAYKVFSFQYDLLMASDTNSMGGSNQWFYFSVTNLIPGKNYTLNIVNFTKTDSLFNYGMAPAFYSLAENRQLQNLEHGWRRFGKQISYKKGKIPRENSKRFYYCLKFTITTKYENDKLFIAHSYPYTTQKLNNYLTQKRIKNDDLVSRFLIGKSISKRPIEGLMICYPINKKRDYRKAVIVMARQHPGETQGSYVCEGVIDKLLGKNKQSQFLLKNYVFYVIPMVNVDGVVFGHYRCNLLGKDLNRKWNISQKDLSCPQVVAIKQFIQQLSKQRDIRFILDLHGHSKKLNSFFYGNPFTEHPEVVRIFPFLCSKLHQGIQYLNCTFTTQQYKKKAARVYLSYFYHLIHVYTFQSSFYAYFQDGKKVEFTPKEYRKLGGTLIYALAMQLQHQIKFQQSFQFNLKQYNSKEYLNSTFVKRLMQLKNSKDLINVGVAMQSGSDSKPQEGQLSNQQMQSLKIRKQSQPEVVSSQDNSKTVKVTRRDVRSPREYKYNNKAVKKTRFLQISKINSVLPDKFQLALQPIRNKQPLPEPINYPLSFAQSQTQNKLQIKLFDLKASDIQSCNLSNSQKKTGVRQRRLNSLIHSMNNNKKNIVVRVEDHLQSLPRSGNRITQIHTRDNKNAFSQTMITFNKDQGNMRSSQLLPAVETSEKERYDLMWPKISHINIGANMKGAELTKQTELLFSGMIKRFIKEKQIYRREQIANRSLQEKGMSLKKRNT